MSTSNPVKVRLHFTLGPVQGFVGESRRTRDLWGSSFMLSYLSGHAIAAVRQGDAGARMVLPSIQEDALLKWIEGDLKQNQPPTIGTLPNRFVAEFDARDGEDEKTLRARAAERACSAKKAIQDAWLFAANAVQSACFKDALPLGKESEGIWRRQVEHFWEIAWILTVGDDPKDLNALDVRKNWRTKDYAPEAGDKCSVMTGWQELSGYVRSWPDEKAKQKSFWDKARKPISNLNLQDGEQLCAVAAVKRLYPTQPSLTRYPATPESSGVSIQAQINWPSTRFMAAVPWLTRVLKNPATVTAADTFIQQLKAADISPEEAERNTKITCLEGLEYKLRYLDSNLYDRRSLDNPRVTGFSSTQSKQALAAAERLYEAAGGPPSSYYALLLMDGDSMGALLRVFGEAGQISAPTQALGAFSQRVPKQVQKNNGVTVYAGGDDVLALLPAPDALACALALEEAYRDAFQDAIAKLPAAQRNTIKATISAALLFVDAQLPLQAVLAEAHRLLDKVAKDANGRSSIATSLWKPSGVNAQWTTTWEHLREAGAKEEGKHALERIGRHFVAKDGRPDARNERAMLSNSLLYRLRDQLCQLFDTTLDVPGTVGVLPDGLDPAMLQTLMTALLLQSQEISGEAGVETCREVVEELRSVCQQRRNSKLPQDKALTERTFTFDALLLARFLAHGGQEEA